VNFVGIESVIESLITERDSRIPRRMSLSTQVMRARSDSELLAKFASLGITRTCSRSGKGGLTSARRPQGFDRRFRGNVRRENLQESFTQVVG